MTSYDVASTIHQSLAVGAGAFHPDVVNAAMAQQLAQQNVMAQQLFAAMAMFGPMGAMAGFNWPVALPDPAQAAAAAVNGGVALAAAAAQGRAWLMCLPSILPPRHTLSLLLS
jgi:hypothetical protein